MKRTRRLFLLLEYLDAGNSNMARLMKELSTGKRQVYRDIKTLRGLGFDIKINPLTRNYNILNEAILPKKHLEFEEAFCLLSVGYEAGGRNPIPFLDPAYRAAVKIHNLLPETIRSRLKSVESVLEILPFPVHSDPDLHPLFKTILHCHEKREALRIRYRKDDGEVYLTLLSPYKLIFQSRDCRTRSWHVVGRSSVDRAVKLFHLDRITSVEKTEHTFEIPNGFTLKRFFKNAWRLSTEKERDHHVVVLFSSCVAEELSKTQWHHTQKIRKNDDGSILFFARVSGLKEISCWILSFGKDAKVLQPQILRDLLKEHVEGMTEHYQ